ncbi:hypothetical protein A3800_05750 [Streptomyces badius]|nr:hypothetical protein A3838_05755 [Streptomyces badius]RAN24573.1 hypothetical protein A3800_05750 [Streptomyces badius]
MLVVLGRDRGDHVPDRRLTAVRVGDDYIVPEFDLFDRFGGSVGEEYLCTWQEAVVLGRDRARAALPLLEGLAAFFFAAARESFALAKPSLALPTALLAFQ